MTDRVPKQTPWLSRADVALYLDVSDDTFDRRIRGNPKFPKPYNFTETREGTHNATQQADWRNCVVTLTHRFKGAI